MSSPDFVSWFPCVHMVAGGKNNETAEEYFQQVMEKTGTAILWPSRLKIGAKSKKGGSPQLKLSYVMWATSLAVLKMFNKISD